MTHKDSITAAMDELAKDPDVVFVGYGLRYGKAMGTLKNVTPDRVIETPVAENLMVGLAIGLSLRGKKPVVFIERADFLLNALDAIVNHLCKIELMSRGQFKPAVIFRVVVGNDSKPLFTGETHTQDFTKELKTMLNGRGWAPPQKHFYVEPLGTREQPPPSYVVGVKFAEALQRMEWGQSTMFIEYKDQL